MLNRVNTEKIKQWILSRLLRSFYFHRETGETHSAVFCLKMLNALKEVNIERIINELLKHHLPDGGFGANEDWKKSDFENTYLAIDTLHMLNRIPSIDKEKVVNFILSLKNLDGGFSSKHSEDKKRFSSLWATSLAVNMLYLLGEIDRVDEKTVNFILGEQMDDGRFGTLEITYYALLALQRLGKLDSAVLSKAVNYVLSLQNLDGGFKWRKEDSWSSLESTDYAIGILKMKVY